MTTVDRLLHQGRRRLAGARAKISGREALLLLGHVLERSEPELLARGDSPVSEDETERFLALIERRREGEPAAYLLGSREFYGRRFAVDSRVLIPRPETEHLVEAALEAVAQQDPRGPGVRILDLGTGSGCVAITLALELAASQVVAVDLSPAALEVATGNARRLGVASRVRPVGSDLAQALELRDFDLVVSNPPYVAPADAPLLSVDVRDHEPQLAVVAPDRGDSVLERLVCELAPLAPGTPLLFEIGYGQSESVRRMTSGSAFRLLEIRPDYAGIPRVAVLRRE